MICPVIYLRNLPSFSMFTMRCIQDFRFEKKQKKIEIIETKRVPFVAIDIVEEFL